MDKLTLVWDFEYDISLMIIVEMIITLVLKMSMRLETTIYESTK